MTSSSGKKRHAVESMYKGAAIKEPSGKRLKTSDNNDYYEYKK